MRTPAELSEIFRAAGRKVTPQRQSIFRALEGNDGHPSAEMVYDTVRQEMETISLKTVYQTLNDLAELGEIAALDLGTGTVRFDPDVERPHHHLVCRSCGEVHDVHLGFSGLELAPEHARGYDVGSAEVVFRGLCPGCRRAAPASGARRAVEDRAVSAQPPHTREEQCPR